MRSELVTRRQTWINLCLRYACLPFLLPLVTEFLCVLCELRLPSNCCVGHAASLPTGNDAASPTSVREEWRGFGPTAVNIVLSRISSLKSISIVLHRDDAITRRQHLNLRGQIGQIRTMERAASVRHSSDLLTAVPYKHDTWEFIAPQRVGRPHDIVL